MARGVNKVILIGNLGQDPEVRYSATGVAWCSVSLATNERRKDPQTGEYQDHTEWHRVTLLGRMAEVAKEYLRKGSKIYIDGRLQTRKYTDKNNVERYQTDIVANDMQMLDSKSSSAATAAGFDDYGQGSSPPRSAPSSSPPQSSSPRPQPMPESNHHPGFDEDVPF